MNNDLKSIEWISVDELLTYPNNAKKHDAQQIERMKRSIEQFGFNDPVAIDKNNVIIEGHGRLMASKELGIEKLPCIRLEHLTDEEVKAYRNVHNKLNMDTGFDYDMLEMDLGEITNIDMTEFGFDTAQFDPNELDDFFIESDADTGKKESKKFSVTCPHCGETFFVNEKGEIVE